VADVEPAATVTEAGTPTRLTPADRLTARFAVGADVSVTVPVDEHPAVTLLGERVSEETD